MVDHSLAAKNVAERLAFMSGRCLRLHKYQYLKNILASIDDPDSCSLLSLFDITSQERSLFDLYVSTAPHFGRLEITALLHE